MILFPRPLFALLLVVAPARMISHACWLGCMLPVFFVAMHILLIKANATVPAQLPERTFIALVVAFVVAVIVWALAQRLRFRRTR